MYLTGLEDDMIDPVDADLNRHLNKLDREDAQAEAEKAKVEEWMQDADKIKGVWDELMFQDDLENFGLDVASALIGHPDDRAARALRLLDVIEEKIREEMKTLAPDAVEADIKQAELDHGEDLAEEQEFRRTHGDY